MKCLSLLEHLDERMVPVEGEDRVGVGVAFAGLDGDGGVVAEAADNRFAIGFGELGDLGTELVKIG